MGAPGSRAAVSAGFDDTGVRGVVVDARTGRPLGGVEVRALRQIPSFQPLIDRFRGLFTSGLLSEPPKPQRVIGSAVSNPDGTFEILGLRPGLLFVDGRSDGWFVRTPPTARLARGQIAEGLELRATPGGRVRGIVLGADGAPAAFAQVSLRPGLNAFLGQITERNYRWLEAVADDEGRFDIPGVPPGTGYAISAASPSIALEEEFGIEVRAGQVTDVVLRGHPGGVVGGRVIDADGAPVEGANVAMVYLDMSRVLFSADGRTEPIATDRDGRFRIERVAAGRVAVLAVADGMAQSGIEELAVVDGGVYEDLQLQLGVGAIVRGVVVDDLDRPVEGARVVVRPFERPNDPEFLKLLLKIRHVETTTGQDGRFEARGLSGERLFVQAGKSGYTTAVRMGLRLDGKDIRVQLMRGAVIRGRVELADGEPAKRFRVQTSSRPIPGETAGPDGPRASTGTRRCASPPRRRPTGSSRRSGWGRRFEAVPNR
ncbi:MAG: hypothetical protein Fur0037_19360 [Planctomycetota bacterium]